MQINGGVHIGSLGVEVAKGNGFDADELADQAMRRILYVSADVPQPLRDQALAYQERLRAVVRSSLEQAQRSARTTMLARLRAAGMHDAARLVEGD